MTNSELYRNRNTYDISAAYIFFIVGLVLWLSCMILRTSTYANTSIDVILRAGVKASIVFCFISELLNNKLTVRSMALFVLLLSITIILYRVGERTVLYLLVFAYVSRSYDLKTILRPAFACTICIICFIILSNKAGIIQSYDLGGVRPRRGLGFGWPTYLSHYYLNISVMYTILRWRDIKYKEIILLLIPNIIIYYYTDSRNSFYLTILYLIMCTIIKRMKINNDNKLIKILTTSIFPICFIISIVIYINVDPTTWEGYYFDRMLSGRITLTHRAIDIYGINLFGNVVHWVGLIEGGQVVDYSQHVYVDCSYINALINYGWIATCLLLLACTIVSFKVSNSNSIIVGLALGIFAVHSIVDPQWLFLHYCPLMLLLGSTFDSDDEWSRKLSFE